MDLSLRIATGILAVLAAILGIILRGKDLKIMELEKELKAEREKNKIPPVPPKPDKLGVTKLVLTDPRYPGYREEVMRTVRILAETETMYRISTSTGGYDINAQIMWIPKKDVELLIIPQGEDK